MTSLFLSRCCAIVRSFAPFAQVDSTSTRHHGGAGLGLAICRELVAMMDGRLWVESRLGAGTTFHFVAKFGVQRDAEPLKPGPVRELKDLPVLVISGSRCQVGEDGKGPREVTQRLREAGVADVTMTLYPDARHEILNETNRDEVTADVIAWLDARLPTRD